MEEVRVAELFAGVGGFRLGLEGLPGKEQETGFKVVFSNQWEPGKKKQWASEIYEKRFNPEETHINRNIEQVWNICPDHDLLVGGFPCQDYSVARTVSGEMGIKGEKGKLWAFIKKIVKLRRPPLILLENVPRLLNSPSKQRGLNFAKIVNDFIRMNYDVEWRVIDAAEYGMPQSRSRVFILAYSRPDRSAQRKNESIRYGMSLPSNHAQASRWLLSSGPFAEKFPVSNKNIGGLQNLPRVGATFIEGEWSGKTSIFKNSGYAFKYRPFDGNGRQRTKYVFWTFKALPDYSGKKMKLKNVLEKRFDKKYEIDPLRLDEWKYAKGAKNEFRLRPKDRGNVEDEEVLERYDACMKAPFVDRRKMWMNENWRTRFNAAVGEDSFYHYDEGSMRFDELDGPSRTIVTAEIGSTPSRMRHIFEIPGKPGTYRRLMPIETERLNMFPDDWTKIDGIKDSTRGFLMGNALVVGIIERLRGPLRELIVRGTFSTALKARHRRVPSDPSSIQRD